MSWLPRWAAWHPCQGAKLALTWQLHTRGHFRRQRVLQQCPGSGTAPGLHPAHKDLWDPNLLVGNTTQTPMAPCPSPHPSRAPCWDSGRAGHVHRVPGGDTRPVSLPSFHSLQEMMNLCLAQAALVSWAHLSTQGSGWGALHSLAVLLPGL